MPEGQLPPEAGNESSGGGITEAITQTDATLYKIAQMAAQSPEMPEEAKAGFAAALEAFRGALTSLTGGGAAQPQAGGQPGAVAPEQGASGSAMPVSHQAMRG